MGSLFNQWRQMLSIYEQKCYSCDVILRLQGKVRSDQVELESWQGLCFLLRENWHTNVASNSAESFDSCHYLFLLQICWFDMLSVLFFFFTATSFSISLAPILVAQQIIGY